MPSPVRTTGSLNRAPKCFHGGATATPPGHSQAPTSSLLPALQLAHRLMMFSFFLYLFFFSFFIFVFDFLILKVSASVTEMLLNRILFSGVLLCQTKPPVCDERNDLRFVFLLLLFFIFLSFFLSFFLSLFLLLSLFLSLIFLPLFFVY